LSLTVDYLAEQTGMVLRRVERALADLKAAGLVTHCPTPQTPS